MKEFNPDQLLELFVGDDEMRPKLHKPWRKGEYIYATESHFCIRIPGNMSATEYPDNGMKIEKHFAFKTEPDGVITLDQLREALASAPLEDELEEQGEDTICPECDGTGEVEWEYWSKQECRQYSDTFECPRCLGDGYIDRERLVPTGRKVISYTANIRITDTILRANMLDILRLAMEMIGADSASFTAGKEGQPCLFSLPGNIDIIIMPITQIGSCQEYICHTIELKK